MDFRKLKEEDRRFLLAMWKNEFEDSIKNRDIAKAKKISFVSIFIGLIAVLFSIGVDVQILIVFGIFLLGVLILIFYLINWEERAENIFGTLSLKSYVRLFDVHFEYARKEK